MYKQLIRFASIILSLQVCAVHSIAQNFTKITTGSHVNDGKGSRSVNFVDVNNDAYPDLFISNGKSGGENNLLYLNNQDGTFTEVTTDEIVSDGLSSDGASFADGNNDGLLDCFIGNWYGQTNLLYYYTDSAAFDLQEYSLPSNEPSHSESSSWSDIDNDGDLDLFVANSGGDLKNFLYINDGNGYFTKDTVSPITTDQDVSRCGVWSDYDNDGDQDLFVANETGYTNKLYENIGSGSFITVTTGEIVTDAANSWGASWGDYDNDGDFDLFVANNSSGLNFLYQNNNDKTFTKITTDPIVFDFSNSVGSSWIDYDNDGDLDMFVANGFGPTNQTNFLFENDGTGAFSKISGEAIVTDQGWSYGCGWADYDRDGDKDLMVAKWLNETENNAFYENSIGSSNNWLSISCIGTEINQSAIGAKVKVKATINGNPVWQIKEISSQHGYCSQNSYELIFGLGNATVVDSLIMIWDNNNSETFEAVPINQFLTYYQPGIRLKADKQFEAAPAQIQFTSTSGLTINTISWDFGDSNNSSEVTPLHTYFEAGLYTVAVTADALEGNYTDTRTDYIALHGDTLFVDDIEGTAGTQIKVPIKLTNHLPLNKITVPIQWSGDLDISFVNIENSGLRSEFMTLTQTHIDPFNKRLTFFLESPLSNPLSPDTGIIAELVFNIAAGSPNGSTLITLNNYNSNELIIESLYGNYLPTKISGNINLSCCIGIRGNIDGDSSDLINIADLVYMVAYSFNSPAGPAPPCFEEADIDASAALNIADIVYLVDYSFGTPTGPAPVSCP